ncbi:MAG: DNA primase [Bacteroidales bacterium]|nr:DNA primase [Bacteroidales bacterium]
MISQNTIDRIFDAAQIVDVVSDYVDLKRRGGNYVGRCPFHEEKTPSFMVSPTKNIYKCFGCGKGGNAVNFVMEYEHLSYVEALRQLARKFHIEIEETGRETPQQQEQRSNRESMLVLMAHAQKLFASLLMEHQDGRAIGLAYFKERGLREDTIRKFGLGYCLPQRDAFTRQMLQDGFKQEMLVATGMTIEGEHGPYDRFWGRVMFPVYDTRGQVVAFGGRVLTTDKTKKVAKYVNSPESEIYHKSDHLYGIYQARQAIGKEDKCYLVEGYLDVLSMAQSGIENVVASSGTSLTTEQIKLISRFTSNVTVLYDGDAAGIKASLRGIDMILEAGLHVRIVLLPDGEDPDSYAQSHSTAELKAFLAAEEVDFITFKTRLLLSEAQDDPIQRGKLISDIIRSISVIPDAVMRSVYIQECCRTLHVEERMMVAEVDKLRVQAAEQQFQQQRRRVELGREHGISSAESEGTPEHDPTGTAVRIQHAPDELDIAEREIIRLMMMYGSRQITPEPDSPECSVAEYILGEMEADDLHFERPLYRRIAEEIGERNGRGETTGEQFFVRHREPEVVELAASFFAGKYTLSKIFDAHASSGSTKVSVRKEENHLNEVVPMQLMAYKATKVSELLRQELENIREVQAATPVDEVRLAALLSRYDALSGLKKQLAETLGERVFR